MRDSQKLASYLKGPLVKLLSSHDLGEGVNEEALAEEILRLVGSTADQTGEVVNKMISLQFPEEQKQAVLSLLKAKG